MVIVSEDFIIKNEIFNDSCEIFLYYSKMYEEYVAYGYSAYSVWRKLYNKKEPLVVSYSEQYQMPQILVDGNQMNRLLNSGINLKDSVEGTYYHIKTATPFKEEEYFEWTSMIRENKV